MGRTDFFYKYTGRKTTTVAKKMSKILKKIKKAFKKKPKEQWRMNSIRGLERIASPEDSKMITEPGNPERMVPTFESQTTEELERKLQADRDEQFRKSVLEEMVSEISIVLLKAHQNSNSYLVKYGKNIHSKVL